MAIDPIAAALMFGGDGGGGTDVNAVHYTADSKTDSEKAQARSNIGAVSSADVSTALALKADKTALALTDKKLKYLSELTKGQVWDIEDGTSPAYQQTVPSGAKCVAVNGVGGKTVVWNQLTVEVGRRHNGVTASFSNGVWSFSGTTEDSYSACFQNINVVQNHKYFIGIAIISNPNSISFSVQANKFTPQYAASDQNRYAIVTGTATSAASFGLYQLSVGEPVDGLQLKIVLVDLTHMFGSGNEPSTVEQFRAMFPSDYYAYNTGTLLSANVTSVDSKDSNSVSLGSLTIPAALRTAHPLHSAGAVYDEYDIENKKFIKRVGSVDLGTLNWGGGFKVPILDKAYSNNLICVPYTITSDVSANRPDKTIYSESSYYGEHQLSIKDSAYTDAAAFKAAMSGVMLYYELATPEEIDISEYFTDDNLLTVEAGGTVTFTQDNDVESNLSVPNSTEYAVKLDLATE